MAEPLTLDLVKSNLRIDGNDEDAFLSALIIAARELIEDYTALILTPRTVVETAPSLGRYLELAAFPVVSIDSVSYLDRDGVAQILPGTSYYSALEAQPVRIMPRVAGWGVSSPPWLCSTLPVTITMTAGYTDAAEVPAVVKQAMQLLIGNWYANRESEVTGPAAAAVELQMGVRMLLRKWRRRSL